MVVVTKEFLIDAKMKFVTLREKVKKELKCVQAQNLISTAKSQKNLSNSEGKQGHQKSNRQMQLLAGNKVKFQPPETQNDKQSSMIELFFSKL